MKYGYTVYKACVEDEVFWVAESKDIKECVGQGETPEEAVAELASNEETWLEAAREYGFDIPEQSVEELVVYSGKTMVRMPSQVHADAVREAKEQGVSMNQYIVNAINQANIGNAVKDYLKAEMSKVVCEMRDLLKDVHTSPQMNISQRVPYRLSSQTYQFAHSEC